MSPRFASFATPSETRLGKGAEVISYLSQELYKTPIDTSFAQTPTFTCLLSWKRAFEGIERAYTF
jgi:hypothetical protein